MKFLSKFLLICAIALFSVSAQAIQLAGPQQPGPSLLLFYFPSCKPCNNILQHQAIPYSKTEAGKKFPLLVVNMVRPLPQWLKDAFEEERIKGGMIFPILVKWDGKKELGRVKYTPEMGPILE